MDSHQEAGKAQLQARGSLAGLRTLQSKVAVERPRPYAVAQSEDNLARRLRKRVPVNCEAEKNAVNLESIDLRPHRLPVQVRAKREVEEREGKVPMVNLAASQKAERLLRPSTGKGSRSAERKRARGPHRREDHNNFLLMSLPTAALQFAPRSKPRL
jgi:hypothetical protein